MKHLHLALAVPTPGVDRADADRAAKVPPGAGPAFGDHEITAQGGRVLASERDVQEPGVGRNRPEREVDLIVEKCRSRRTVAKADPHPFAKWHGYVRIESVSRRRSRAAER